MIVDPSHAAGRRDLVGPLSMAAAAVGADGIIVEVHPNPDEAICDGPQALLADHFEDFARAVEQAAALAGKTLPPPKGAARAGGSQSLPELRGTQLRPADYVRDRRIERVVPLLAPDALLDELPLSGAQADVVIRGRRDVCAVLEGTDRRLLVVVGPCSVHDPEATLEYALRLAPARTRAERRAAGRDAGVLREAAYDDRLEGLDQRPASRRLWRCQRWAAPRAARAARRARRRSPGRLRVPRPDHAAVHRRRRRHGARSARARPRARSIASSAPGCRCPWASRTAPTATCRWPWMPCAPRPRRMRSPASIRVARRRSSTRAATPTATSSCAAAKAGPTTMPGASSAALELLDGAGLPKRVMVDLSHDNSGKDPERQPDVAADVGRQIAGGNEEIVGVMLESFLVAGRQDLQQGAELRVRPVDHGRMHRLGDDRRRAGGVGRVRPRSPRRRNADGAALIGCGSPSSGSG